MRLKPTNGGVAAEQVYFSRNAPNTMGGQVLLDGVLYGTNNEGLTAADFDTGETLWQETEGGPGAILYADGMLYVHYERRSRAGRGHARSLPPARTVHAAEPPAHPRGDREMAWAYPVVANGRLYIRDLGSLWCYDVAAE
ncbi:MAG: hypothetical protein R2724_24405 [Bryobacterales bacterium]